MKRAVAAVLAAAFVLVWASSPSGADTRLGGEAPAVTWKYAKQMKCKWGEATSMASGGPNRGVGCVVRNRQGRTEFRIIKYANITRALDYWRDWLSWDGEYSDGPSAFFVHKGNVIITDQGHDPYSLEWSEYAADRINGRLMSGYKY